MTQLCETECAFSAWQGRSVGSGLGGLDIWRRSHSWRSIASNLIWASCAHAGLHWNQMTNL